MAKEQVLQTVVTIGGAVDASLGRALKSASGMLSGALGKAGLIGLAGAAGAAAKKLADDYMVAFRKIRLGTGATGAALTGLMDDYRAALAKSTSSSEQVATAIADLNTAYGATGETLREVADAALIVSKRFGDDLSGLITSNAKALKAWGRTAEDAANALNFFRKLSQATGVSVTSLQERTAQAAPQLRALGYSLETGAAMLAQLEKNGVKGEAALSALNRLAAEGADGWGAYYEQIKGAASETEAITLASELFGAKAGPAMASAIRAGAFEAGELARSLASDGESLQQLDQELRGTDDYLQSISNTLASVLQPYVQSVLERIDYALKWWVRNGDSVVDDVKRLGASIMDDMLAPIRAAGDALEKFSGWWSGLKSRLSGEGADRGSYDTGSTLTPAEWQDAGLLAAGGWATQPSICGEAGPEAVISLDPAHRAENIRYWQEAGRALGVGQRGGTTYDLSGMVFAPTIQAASGRDTEILGALRAHEREFADAIISALDARAARAY